MNKKAISAIEAMKTRLEEWVGGLESPQDEAVIVGVDAALTSLRAAPETVSLEGMERWQLKSGPAAQYMDPDRFGAYVRFDALHRLVTPVQPSAVVSEWQRVAHVLGERLGRTGPEGYYSMTPDKWLEWATEEVGHLHYQVEQKPVHHPVAPVQSGGVDRESLWEAIRYSELVDDDVAGEIVDIVIAHLTTTQSSKENNLEKQ